MSQNLKKGIAKIGYAMITESAEDGSYVYDDVKWLKSDEAGGREYTAEPNGETTEIYADSTSVYSAEENNGYDLTVILLAVIDNIEKDWLNNSEIEEGGVLEIANPKAKPKFAFITIDNTTNGNGETTIYFNCSVSKRPKIAGKTTEGSFEAQFPEYSIAARPRPTDKWVRATLPQSEQFTTIPEITIKSDTSPVEDPVEGTEA